MLLFNPEFSDRTIPWPVFLSANRWHSEEQPQAETALRTTVLQLSFPKIPSGPEWHCGTSDRHTASRVPGPNGHLRRGAPAANSFRLCGVLQSSAHALGITKRCTLASRRPTVWCHCRYSHLGRAASPIRPDIIFGKDRSLTVRLYLNAERPVIPRHFRRAASLHRPDLNNIRHEMPQKVLDPIPEGGGRGGAP
jgi:hypothetical protein